MMKLLLRLRRSFFFGAAVLGVILLLFILFLFIPKYMENRNLAKEVDKLSEENARIQQLVLTSEHSGKKLQDIHDLLEKYKNMVPPRDRLSDVLDEIASRAQAEGLEVLSLRPLREAPYLESEQEFLKEEGLKAFQVVIEMKTEGHYFDVGRYLSQLEQGSTKILVEQVGIQNKRRAGSEITKDPKLSITLTLGILMQTPLQDTT